MPRVTLVATSATLSLRSRFSWQVPLEQNTYIELSDGKPQLSYEVQLNRGEYIKLSSGENFRNGVITIFPETDESNGDDRKTVGSIYYAPGFEDSDDLRLSSSATYEIRVLVPRVRFDELLATARLGRLPSQIWIHVEGMEYRSPDGSSKEWDNKAFPRLAVESVDFYIPLAYLTKDDKSTDAWGEVFPPTRSQINELSQKLDLLATDINSALRLLLWSVLVMGSLILILMIFR